MGSPVNRKRYGKEDLIKKLITFISDNGGRFPTKEDWKTRKIIPSLRTFQRVFENLNQAFNEADSYNSIGDYENHLFDKEQELILRKHRRKKRKEKSVFNKVAENNSVQKQMKSIESPIAALPTCSATLSGMIRCHKCGKYKNDWEMAIECVSSFGHEDICEDCISQKPRFLSEEKESN